jgi:mono/diheme cytochrome c family protein
MSRTMRWTLGGLLLAAGVIGALAWRGLRVDAPYAGGREIPTPFGLFRAPNITPDPRTGIGHWSRADFWHALHDGRRPDGAPLYPSFPYTHYTRLDRVDSDALYAYLRSLPPVERANRPHALDFPYDQRWLLVAWRALFFRPGTFEVQADRDARWNRGAYLVQGLGHCGACHEARNALGAIVSDEDAAGGVVLDWVAPSLRAPDGAGVAHWSEAEVVALLRDGVSARGSAMGPMAEVVYESLQHLEAQDLGAMAAYLRAMPQTQGGSARRAAASRPDDEAAQRGARGYAEHCADCHGEHGQGKPPGFPALAGNRALTLHSPVNPIRAVLYGGYAPGTAGNPAPLGMPPYHATLTDTQIAEILGYARGAWGNAARPIAPHEVARQRTGPLW